MDRMRRETRAFLLMSSLLAYACGGGSSGGGSAGHGGKGGHGGSAGGGGSVAGNGGTSAGGSGGSTGGSGGSGAGGSGGTSMGGNGGTSAGGNGGSAGADAAAGAGGTSDGGGDVSDSGGNTDGGTDADAALSMCGTATSGGSGESCSTVVPIGPCVMETASTDAPPTPAGGSFVAGTFDLQSSTLYTVPDAGTDAGAAPTTVLTREVSVLTGSGTSFSFQNAITSGVAIARSNGTVTTDGSTKFTVTPTCPVADGSTDNPGQIDYTAAASSAGTTITTFSVIAGTDTVRVKVYKKRN